uniref:Cdc6 C-terminal domain-containing protein n=1 Tax=Aegilops tauschii subsp. strangulata TaxID=200361 RepID=A0A453FYD0_AEGTS
TGKYLSAFQEKGYYSRRELNKSYIEICRSTQVPAVGMLEFSNMCMILSDQGILEVRAIQRR